MSFEIIDVITTNGPTIQVSSNACGGASIDTSNLYPYSNPNNYATSGNLQATGISLFNLISGFTGSNSAIGSYNIVYKTGDQNITGVKTFVNEILGLRLRNIVDVASVDVSVQTLYDNLGVESVFWGMRQLLDTAALTSVDYQNRILDDNSLNTSLDWQNKILTGTWNAQSIRVSGKAVLTGINDSNYLTSGQTGLFVFNSQTGQFYPYSNPSNFTNSGNLQTSGSNLYNLINNFSGVFNNSGSQYQGQINTLTINLQSTGVSLKNSDTLISGNIITTGQTLDTKINNLSGYLRNTSISVTGFSSQTGQIGLSGVGNVTVFTGVNNSILISGISTDTSSFSTITNLQSTGQNLYNYITSLSGAEDNKITNINNLTGSFYPYNNPSNFANSGNLQSTGQNLQSRINLLNTYTGISITGLGSNGYIPKFTSDGTGIINSNIIDSGNSVNITTTTTINAPLNVSGQVSLSPGSSTTPSILIGGLAGFGSLNGLWMFGQNASTAAAYLRGGVQFSLITNTDFGWSSSSSDASAVDTRLFRESAGTISQSNTSSPQEYRLYNTRTNSTDFERGYFRWSGNVLQIGNSSGSLGNGVSRGVSLQAGGNLSLISNNNQTGAIFSGGYINLYGNTSGTAPSSTILSIPLTESIYGDTSAFLGKPAGWMDIYISGRPFKLPYYQP